MDVKWKRPAACVGFFSAEQEKVLKNAVETKKKSTARVADLEDKLKNSKTVRERELKQAQKDVDQAKKRYDQSIAKTKDKEQVSCQLLEHQPRFV